MDKFNLHHSRLPLERLEAGASLGRCCYLIFVFVTSFFIGLLEITGRYYSVCLQSYAFYANVARSRGKKRGNLFGL